MSSLAALLAVLASGGGTTPPPPPSTTLDTLRQVTDRASIGPDTTLPTGGATGRSYSARLTVRTPVEAVRIGMSGIGSAGPSTTGWQQAWAIEMPDGTLVAVTHGGAHYGTVPAGGHLVSDLVTLPRRLLAGERIMLRSDVRATTGWASLRPTIPAAGERFAQSSTDYTLGGTIPDPGYGASGMPLPVYVTGLTTASTRAWGIVGDSIAAASGDPGDSYTAAWGWFGRWCQRMGVPSVSWAQGGTTSSHAQHDSARGAAWYQGGVAHLTDVVWAMGRNDLGTSTSFPAALAANGLRWTLWAQGQHPTLRVWPTTITPYTDSSDGWTTLAGQTSHYPGDTSRAQYNAWLRDGAPLVSGVAAPGSTSPSAVRIGAAGHPWAGVIDTAAAAEPEPDKWVPGWTTDGLHPSSVGYPALASALALVG